MKTRLIIISSALLLAVGCSHSNSGARTTPDTGRIQGQYIAGTTQLVDAGNTTPEAALESIFWAMASGNYDTVIGSYIPQMQKEVEGWYGDKAKFMVHIKKFESFKGLQIVARKNVADDKVELRYYCEFQNQPASKRTDQIQSLVKMGGAWKCADKNPYTTNWDEGSQPEPQP
jgi:uncharacterized protein YchJ